MVDKTRNPKIARRYVDADGKNVMQDGELIGEAVAINFHQYLEGSEVEARSYFTIDLSAASPEYLAYSAMHGTAQRVGDKFNSFEGDWPAIVKYGAECQLEIDASQWKKAGTGTGGKTHVWKTALLSLINRVNDKPSDKGNAFVAKIGRFLSLDETEIRSSDFRTYLSSDDITEAQVAGLKGSELVKAEIERLRKATAKPSDFDTME